MLRTDSVAQYVMSEVFPAIDHRPSEEYAEIELPGPNAKERCIHSPLYMNLPNLTLNCPSSNTDAHRRAISTREILSARFNLPGTHTAILETRRVATVASSSRPSTPRPAPSSPLPLPHTNVSLGVPALQR
jgi:hypothetical protein